MTKICPITFMDHELRSYLGKTICVFTMVLRLFHALQVQYKLCPKTAPNFSCSYHPSINIGVGHRAKTKKIQADPCIICHKNKPI